MQILLKKQYLKIGGRGDLHLPYFRKFVKVDFMILNQTKTYSYV